MPNIINKTILNSSNILRLKTIKLTTIKFNKQIITFNDIDYFNISDRNNNDKYNKKRENIICAIINNKIPNEFYTHSIEWKNKKKNINNFIIKLSKENNIKNIKHLECILKGGRNYHYDFELKINGITYYIEFKFNNVPQFVSPMKPSRYLNMEFEPWFYDEYLNKIAIYGNLEIPTKEEYCTSIHSNKVKCMKEYKSKYDTDCNFKKYCMKIDKEAIKKFIGLSEIKIQKLSSYLLESQKNKIYMIYQNNTFKYETVDESLYQIKKLIKKENTNYICETESGIKLEIKLRFKNGCGLQFPAFQIKRKIPTVKMLKELCIKKDIDLPSKIKKKDILSILDKESIIY